MTDITDLPAIIGTLEDPERLKEIQFIVDCCNEKLISFDEAEVMIDKVIYRKGV